MSDEEIIIPTEFDAERPHMPQPFDTVESFAAFQAYLALPPPRRLSALAKLWPLPQLTAWRESCGWVERAHAVDRGDRNASDVDARHLRLLGDAAELAQIEIRKLLRQAETSPAQTIEVRELARLVRDVVQLERLVSGQSTENVAVAEVDLSALSLDEIETLRALQAKAGVGE